MPRGQRLVPGVDKIPEAWVKKRVKEILNTKVGAGLKWDMPPANIYGNAGRHDFIVCQNGMFWTIETKAGKNRPTGLQKVYAKEVYAAGGFCLCVNELNLKSVTNAMYFVEKYGTAKNSFTLDDFLNFGL